MCRIALAVTAIFILVDAISSWPVTETLPLQPQPTISEPDSPETSKVFTRGAQVDDTATSNSVGNAESTEEQQGYNSYYAPATVNFHDIYSNSLALLTGEDSMATTTKEDITMHLSNPVQFVEFRPEDLLSSSPSTVSSSPAYANGTHGNFTISVSNSTDEPYSDINVIPITKKDNYQRGVLDLLFPAARVRTFKAVFDTFRRIMSHTFR